MITKPKKTIGKEENNRESKTLQMFMVTCHGCREHDNIKPFGHVTPYPSHGNQNLPLKTFTFYLAPQKEHVRT